MSQVVLIRPGATEYDEQHRVQGILDIPLSERGKVEVARLAERLATLELAALYFGPGESVQRTAEVVGRAIGHRPKRLDDLRNLDLGLWQGLQLDELKRRHFKVYRQWLEDPLTVCPPQGESNEEGLERARSALKPLLRRHRDARIALVVAEPMAQLIAGYLRRAIPIRFEEDLATGCFEEIEIDLDALRNGDGG